MRKTFRSLYTVRATFASDAQEYSTFVIFDALSQRDAESLATFVLTTDELDMMLDDEDDEDATDYREMTARELFELASERVKEEYVVDVESCCALDAKTLRRERARMRRAD